MGTWGTALYSDDIASDLRDEFRDLIGDGLSATEAVDRLLVDYSPDDPDIEPVFWLALADIQWKLGRLEERTKANALNIIENGKDLARWSDSKLIAKRRVVLEKLKIELALPPPIPKKVPKRYIEANDWEIGEIVGFQLGVTRRWVLLRVIGHHIDNGGRFAVCELLDWTGEALPEYKNTISKLLLKQKINSFTVRTEEGPRHISQFMFSLPKKDKDKFRIKKIGIITHPKQKKGYYTIFVWDYIDKTFKEVFNLE